MAPSLKVVVNGMEFDNPFLLGSGPPGTNGRVIAKSFDLGWGGNVCKTISLDASKVVNTNPRYGKLKAKEDKKVIVGFENIELISDRPFDTWIEELTDVKKKYPNKILVASIMEEKAIAREEINETIFDAIVSSGGRVSLEHVLSAIQAPALIVWGRQDRVLAPENAEVFAEGIQNSRVVLLDGVGHVPMLEVPERSASLWHDFLQQHPVR